MTPTLLNNRYRIIQTLGSGGFGDTFLAEDTQMPSQRRCVIKQLKPITNNPQIYQLVQQRFQREAAILEELGEENPQIPRLYAYLESDEQFYLVQEWIQGETLRAKVKHLGVMSESAVKEILISLLPVLDFVHSKRMIHRDIKPDNIIWRLRDGKPVLIDFGAVRETMSTVLNSHGSTTSSIVIGTPGYMPPEQAAGRPVYSSDLYSLGFTALYLLTGNTPQQLETDPQTGDILWRSDAVSVSSSLAAVLDKAIQSHPRDRFSTAKAMLDALQSGTIPQVSNFSDADTTVMPSGQLFSKPTETLPQPNSRRSRWLTGVRDKPEKFWMGSLIFGCLIGLFILLGFFLPKPSPPFVEEFLGRQTNKFDDFPWLSQRPVTDGDLRGKNAYELDIMRNSIYARHGRKFLNKDLQDYFNRQPWYRPKYNPEEFPDRLLSPLEERNVIYILAYQKRYGLRWFP